MTESWPLLSPSLSHCSSHHSMGNYSSTWSLSPSILYQGVAGKESDFFFPDQMSPETERELPAEIWADVISFLSFPDQVTNQIAPLTLTSKYL